MAARILFVLVCLVSAVAAQSDFGAPRFDHRILVHVRLPNGSECDSSTKVELLQSTAASVASGITDKTCTVEFFGVPPGVYHLSISGRGFAAIETGDLPFTSPDAESVEVTIPGTERKSADETALRAASASVAELAIPKRAAKEFEKASREMDEHNWHAALTTLQKTIGLYPKYAAAYNNLGVVYARLGDRNNEAAALAHAIEIDDRYVPAHVNLARMEIATNDFPAAEDELKKATTLDPTDGVILVLLSYAEFTNHHFDDAAKDCDRVHAMGNIPHAFAHWVAAFAYEQKNQIAEAGNEFRLFVSEEPAGNRADEARKELVNIAQYLSANQRVNSAPH